MATEMKQNIVKIPRLVTKDNMTRILNGYSYVGLDEAIGKFIDKNLASKTCYLTKRHTALSDTSVVLNLDDGFMTEEVIGEVIGYDDEYFTCNVFDNFYFSNINNPRIRINGECIINHETKEILVSSVKRISV